MTELELWARRHALALWDSVDEDAEARAAALMKAQHEAAVKRPCKLHVAAALRSGAGPHADKRPALDREAVLEEIEEAQAERRAERIDSLPARRGRTDRFG